MSFSVVVMWLISNNPLKPCTEHATRFKSIGKAALKGTKQIGKTLTAISDSPDKRGQGRLAQISAPQFYNRQQRNDKLKYQHATALSNESLGLDIGKSTLLCLT